MSKSVYLLAGGRQSAPYSFRKLVQAALSEAGKDRPVIGYCGAASGDDAGFFDHMAGEFQKAGAGEVQHAALIGPAADVNRAKRILEAADVIFLSGGDVDGGMEVLEETGMTDFLLNLYRQGKPFFGVSAGSIMLALRWVRWPDPDDTDSAELFDCLGAAGIICDCHDEESGWEELRAELALEPVGTIGYGLVAGSGVKVSPEGAVLALGRPVHRFNRQADGIVRLDDLVPE